MARGAPIRSAMFDSPAPAGVVAGSKPGPVSATSNRSSPGTACRVIVTAAPGACLPTFASASRQQKYTAASTCSGWRPRPVAVTVTGSGLRFAAARSASSSPESRSSGG